MDGQPQLLGLLWAPDGLHCQLARHCGAFIHQEISHQLESLVHCAAPPHLQCVALHSQDMANPVEVGEDCQDIVL